MMMQPATIGNLQAILKNCLFGHCPEPIGWYLCAVLTIHPFGDCAKRYPYICGGVAEGLF